MSFLLFLILSFAAFLLFSGAYLFCNACVRKKELPWLVEEKLKKTSYGKYFSYIYAADQWLKSHKTQDIYIKSHDGLKLHAVWIAAKEPKGTILLAHGYRSTKLLDFGAAAEMYLELGLNVLLPDQRAHGESQGRYITFGVKESQDMLQWIEYHNAHFGMQQIILKGLSMGASTVLYLANENLPENVKGIIADCGFTSPKEIISQVFKRVTRLPAGPSVWIANLLANLFAGFDFNEKDTRICLASSKVPVMLVHGKADDFVPCRMSEQGYNACSGPKHLLLVEGAEHGVSFIKDRHRYTEMILAFLETNLEGFR